MRRFEKLPTPQGIGAGQTATVNLPLGPTYHRLYIRMADGTGDVAAGSWGDNIGEIRLMVNGDVRIEIDAADLEAMNKFYGQEADAGVLPLFLSQPWARTIPGEDNTAYGTAANMATFTLEMDLKPGITIGELSVYAIQSEPKAFGPHLRIQRFSDQMAMIGTKEISDLPRGAYNMLGLHITTDKIDGVEVLADNRQVSETDKVARQAHLRLADRLPQAGFTHLDFIPENRLGEALPMALNDFRVKLDVTAVNQNFKVYAVSVQGVQARTA
ncbi:MAG: hypothetical protein CSA72_08380 [Rhodobacterales bacterium]|nr:MAG: hypothetical protein CSA72_08380 [Rhodobacterales bacterium]